MFRCLGGPCSLEKWDDGRDSSCAAHEPANCGGEPIGDETDVFSGHAHNIEVPKGTAMQLVGVQQVSDLRPLILSLRSTGDDDHELALGFVLAEMLQYVRHLSANGLFVELADLSSKPPTALGRSAFQFLEQLDNAVRGFVKHHRA